MNINREELAEKFGYFIRNDKAYQPIQKIVMDNSKRGGVWLIGGYVYRNLIKLVYGTNGHKQPKDYDFLVEEPKKEMILPFGWIRKKTMFGSPKFFRIWDFTRVDVVPLANVHVFHGEKNKSDINTYLNGVPLNVQSIAYNLRTGRIEGNAGLESIEKRSVSIMSREKLEEAVRMRKDMTVEKYIQESADSLGFNIERR